MKFRSTKIPPGKFNQDLSIEQFLDRQCGADAASMVAVVGRLLEQLNKAGALTNQQVADIVNMPRTYEIWPEM